MGQSQQVLEVLHCVFLLLTRTAFAQSLEQLALDIVPTDVSLVKGVQNHQAVDLELKQSRGRVVNGRLLHVESKFAELSHIEELVCCLLKQDCLDLLCRKNICKFNKHVRGFLVLAELLIDFRNVDHELYEFPLGFLRLFEIRVENFVRVRHEVLEV